MTDEPAPATAAWPRDGRGRAMRSPESTRSYLAICIQRRWDQAFTRPGNSGVDARQAQLAVDEVIDALRHNPAWLKGLGIGDV